MKPQTHSAAPLAGPARRGWPGRIKARLHWLAIGLWAVAFLAALLPLLMS
jgi:hypothetical protein